jgi:hypothetical protein
MVAHGCAREVSPDIRRCDRVVTPKIGVGDSCDPDDRRSVSVTVVTPINGVGDRADPDNRRL